MDEHLRRLERDGAVCELEAAERRVGGALPATRDLVRPREKRTRGEDEWDLVRIVARYGTAEDLPLLRDAFIAQPDRGELLSPIRALGDRSLAADLHEALMPQGVAHPDTSVGLYWTLGYLGLEEVQPALLRIATEALDAKADYFAGKQAVLGLLNLPCAGMEDELHALVSRALEMPVFHESIPALAIKAGDPDLLDALQVVGERVSSSWNSGIFLGIALFGEQGRSIFEQALTAEWWEAHDRSTGTRGWAYQGARLLQISFARLLELAVANANERGPGRAGVQGFYTLESFLDLRLAECDPLLRGMPPEEPLIEIDRALFDRWEGSEDMSVKGRYEALIDRSWFFPEELNMLQQLVQRTTRYEAELRMLRGMLGCSP